MNLAGSTDQTGRRRVTRWVSVLLTAVFLLSVRQGDAAFIAPRVIFIINPDGAGHPSDALRTYFIDKGVESNIFKGDVLNVYREKRAGPGAPAVRLFIGTMKITSSRNGSCMGHFSPNESAVSSPLIRHPIVMKSDIVVPFLTIDSEQLFEAGTIALKPDAAQDIQRITEFIARFEPNRLVLEGHTDSDGETKANQDLSSARAEAVRQYLIENIELITPAMAESRGYGSARPKVPNDSPANKALNRRIEVIIWE